MLGSITPLGERGRHSHYPVTTSAFLLGAAGAGALTGAAMGTIGGLALGAGPAAGARAAVLAVVLLGALALDAGPWPVPGPRRQVDQRWLDRYRGWVYGLGYGIQLGAGVTTVITSAATYAAVVAAIVSGGPLSGALILGLYGAIRGATPLATARVRNPERLVAFHRGLERSRSPVAAGAIALLAAGCVIAVILAV